MEVNPANRREKIISLTDDFLQRISFPFAGQ